MTSVKSARFRAFLGHNGWLPGLIGIGGIATTVLALVFVTVSDFRRSGAVTTDARVLGATAVSGVGNKSRYQVAVILQVDGVDYAADRYVDWEFQKYAAARETIPVQYDPENPNRIWIVPIRSEPWYGTMRTGGLLVAALMAWWCWSIWKLAGRTVAILDTGERRKVAVTSHVDNSGSRKDMSRVSITWVGPDGEEMQSKGMPAEKASQFPVGSEIEIVIDPDGTFPARWIEEFK